MYTISMFYLIKTIPVENLNNLWLVVSDLLPAGGADGLFMPVLLGKDLAHRLIGPSVNFRTADQLITSAKSDLFIFGAKKIVLGKVTSGGWSIVLLSLLICGSVAPTALSAAHQSASSSWKTPIGPPDQSASVSIRLVLWRISIWC